MLFPTYNTASIILWPQISLFLQYTLQLNRRGLKTQVHSYWQKKKFTSMSLAPKSSFLAKIMVYKPLITYVVWSLYWLTLKILYLHLSFGNINLKGRWGLRGKTEHISCFLKWWYPGDKTEIGTMYWGQWMRNASG